MDLCSHKSIEKMYQPEAMMFPPRGYVLNNDARSLKQVKRVLHEKYNHDKTQNHEALHFFQIICRMCECDGEAVYVFRTLLH